MLRFTSLLASIPFFFTPIQAEDFPTPTDNYGLAENTFRVVLAPRSKTVLSAEVSSRVVKITKEMGDYFDAGEVLVRLDDTLFKAINKKAEFLVERAQEQLNAKERLYRDNVASSFELKDAQAEMASAELELEKAAKDLRSTTIVAPYEGHLENLLVHEHEIVQAGEPLIEIVDDKTLLAKLLIPSKYFNKVKIGQTLKLQVKEVNGEVPAIITHIGAVIDPASSMMKIFAEVSNHDQALRAGMTGITTLEK